MTPYGFLSPLKHTPQLLLIKFFDLMKFDFDPPGTHPSDPGLQGSNSNSLFRALQHEDLTLSIWLGYYKRFPRSFATQTVMNTPKSTRKYLLDHKGILTRYFYYTNKLILCSLPCFYSLLSSKGSSVGNSTYPFFTPQYNEVIFNSVLAHIINRSSTSILAHRQLAWNEISIFTQKLYALCYLETLQNH